MKSIIIAAAAALAVTAWVPTEASAQADIRIDPAASEWTPIVTGATVGIAAIVGMIAIVAAPSSSASVGAAGSSRRAGESAADRRMLPKSMSSDLIRGWTHTRIKSGCKLFGQQNARNS